MANPNPSPSTRFGAGQRTDLGGRPKTNAVLRKKCRELDDELIERLRGLARGADTDAASVAAIRLLLAYGHGAPESKPVEDDDDQVQTTGMTLKTATKVLKLVKGKGEPVDDS